MSREDASPCGARGRRQLLPDPISAFKNATLMAVPAAARGCCEPGLGQTGGVLRPCDPALPALPAQGGC